MVGFIATQMTNLQNQFWSSIVLKYMNILVAIHLANDPEVENQTLQVSHRGPFIGTAFGTTWSCWAQVVVSGR